MINKEELAEFYIDNKNVLIISLIVYSIYTILISFVFNFIKIDSDGLLFFVLSIFTTLFTMYIVYTLYHLLLGKIYYDKFNKNQREKILEKELEKR